MTPKVWTKNFWGFFMRKKHDYEALLKYMAMLKEGRSFRSISDEFGINAERLKCLWILYQTEGESVLHRKQNIKANGKLKQRIVSSHKYGNKQNYIYRAYQGCKRLINYHFLVYFDATNHNYPSNPPTLGPIALRIDCGQ